MDNLHNITMDDIKNNPYIKKIIDENSIDESELTRYFNVFKESYISYHICKDCKGIESCKQKNKGEVYTLTYDNGPLNVIKYCKYLRQQKDIDKISDKYVYTNMPKALLSINLNNLVCKNEHQEILFKVFDDISRKSRNRGVFVIGDYGVGKTFLSSALANSLVSDNNRVCFIKVNSFVSDMARLIVNDSNEYDKLINRIKDSEYVIFDDIGTENVTEFSRDRLLYNILDHRMENHLCTIFTSNFDLKNLELHFNKVPDENSSRICERIRALTDEFVLKGENQRYL